MDGRARARPLRSRRGATGGLNRSGWSATRGLAVWVRPVPIQVTTVGRAAAPRALVSTIDACVGVARLRSRTGPPLTVVGKDMSAAERVHAAVPRSAPPDTPPTPRSDIVPARFLHDVLSTVLRHQNTRVVVPGRALRGTHLSGQSRPHFLDEWTTRNRGVNDPGTGRRGTDAAPSRGRSRLGSIPISIRTSLRGGKERHPTASAPRHCKSMPRQDIRPVRAAR
jgi:hypothetical protein